MKYIAYCALVGAFVLTAPLACSDTNEPGQGGSSAAGAGSGGAQTTDGGGANTDGGSDYGGAAGIGNDVDDGMGGEAGSALVGAGGSTVETTPPAGPIEPHAPLVCTGFSSSESYAMPDGAVIPRKASCSANSCVKFSGEEKQLCCDCKEGKRGTLLHVQGVCFRLLREW